MSRMPALPVSINDDLASNLLSSTTQVIYFATYVKIANPEKFAM